MQKSPAIDWMNYAGFGFSEQPGFAVRRRSEIDEQGGLFPSCI